MKRAVNAICYHLNCSPHDAEMIYYGVFEMNGNYYSSFYRNEDDEEVFYICKNGFAIRRLIFM